MSCCLCVEILGESVEILWEGFYGGFGRKQEAYLKMMPVKKIGSIEAEVCPDHIHMLPEMPPEYSVSSIMGYLKKRVICRYMNDEKMQSFDIEAESFGGKGAMLIQSERIPIRQQIIYGTN